MTQAIPGDTPLETASPVLRHLLRGETWEARNLLRDLSTADLTVLANAAYALTVLCRGEIEGRW